MCKIKEFKYFLDKVKTMTKPDFEEYNDLISYEHYHDSNIRLEFYVGKKTKEGQPTMTKEELLEFGLDMVRVLGEDGVKWLNKYCYVLKLGVGVGVVPPPPCTGSKCPGGGG